MLCMWSGYQPSGRKLDKGTLKKFMLLNILVVLSKSASSNADIL
jgi:hypothetical protein